MLAWNDLAAALMEDFAERAPADRNLARRAFLGPAMRCGIADAAESGTTSSWGSAPPAPGTRPSPR